MKKLTKKEVKDFYNEWNVEITILNDEIIILRKRIQNLCIENGKPATCNYRENIKNLSDTKDFNKAFELYEIINNYEGQMQALRDLACLTNNMNI